MNESTSECRYGGGSTRLYCQVVLTYGVPTNVAVGEADDAAVGEGLGVGDADAEAVDKARRFIPSEYAERVTYQVASGKEIELERLSFDIVMFSWSL